MHSIVCLLTLIFELATDFAPVVLCVHTIHRRVRMKSVLYVCVCMYVCMHVSVCIRARANTQGQQPTSQACVCVDLSIWRQPATALECDCVFINLCKNSGIKLLLRHMCLRVFAPGKTCEQLATALASVGVYSSTGTLTEAATHFSVMCLR